MPGDAPSMDLRFGALGAGTAHLCIDMQNLIAAPESPWNTEWAMRVLPNVLRLVQHAPERAIYTRFIPPQRPDQMPGSWRRYYTAWQELTRAHVDPHLLELLEPLTEYAPRGLVLDKPVYSPFSGVRLQQALQQRQVGTLIISGAETDVCVLASVLGAVDHGYRVVLAMDAICGSRDHTHDALLSFYRSRLSNQVELVSTGAILEAWEK